MDEKEAVKTLLQAGELPTPENISKVKNSSEVANKPIKNSV